METRFIQCLPPDRYVLGNFRKLSTKNTTELESSLDRYGCLTMMPFILDHHEAHVILTFSENCAGNFILSLFRD